MTNTNEEYIARINRVIDYIIANANKHISVAELASIASFSEYHFHRIFKSVTGETLNGYVRRTRLERAANMLRARPNHSITQIALEFGFSSSANFSKAFKAHFGFSPSEYRDDYDVKSSNGKTNSKNGKEIDDVLFEDINMSERHKDLELFKVVLKSMPALHVAYVRTRRGYELSAIEEAWDKLTTWVKARDLVNEDTIVLGINHDDPELSGVENCRYDAAISVPEEITEFSGEIGIQDIPGGKYATFSFPVQNNIGEMMELSYSRLYKWMVMNGISPADSSPFAIYLDPDAMGRGELAHCTLCVLIESF